MTSPSYSTPLPARHLATIIRVCLFSPNEQERFLAAYQAAHPGRLPDLGHPEGLRQMSLMVPDFGDDAKNRMLEEAVADFIARLSTIMNNGGNG